MCGEPPIRTKVERIGSPGGIRHRLIVADAHECPSLANTQKLRNLSRLAAPISAAASE
jgi:hypothetical protein